MKGRIGVATLAIAAIAISALPTQAAAPRARKAQMPYKIDDVNHGVGGPGFYSHTWEEEQAYAFPIRRGERYVSVNVVDDSEEMVAGTIVQFVWTQVSDGAKTGESVTNVPFCGRTDKPVKVKPNIQVEIFLKKGTCDDGTPSLPTNGDIVVEFTRSR